MSASDMSHLCIGGFRACPFGSMPSRIARAMSTSVHPGVVVAASGFGAERAH